MENVNSVLEAPKDVDLRQSKEETRAGVKRIKQ